MALNEAEERATEWAMDVGHWLKAATGTKFHVPKKDCIGEEPLCAFGGSDDTRPVSFESVPDSHLEGRLCNHCERQFSEEEFEAEGYDRGPEDVLEDCGFEVGG